ncbi:MAG: hypothetical protein HZC24_05415 [Rhodocyclales bacterium]|nr:hypothetical protein [Rhodocyclales bacterium]
MIVVGMAADPKPLDAFLYRDTQCAVMDSDAHAAEAAAKNRFELQGGVSGIAFQQLVAALGELSNFRRERVETMPKFP